MLYYQTFSQERVGKESAGRRKAEIKQEAGSKQEAGRRGCSGLSIHAWSAGSSVSWRWATGTN